MDLYDRGYANIRFASDETNYIHKYNYRINLFSEEVFIHEFLHTLERTSKEHGFETADLHDHEKYGYDENGINRLSEWYRDYMRCKIFDKSKNKYVGLDSRVYTLKPINKKNFKFPIEIKFNEEPSNIFEDVKCLFSVVSDIF